jgi:hypothetical protein
MSNDMTALELPTDLPKEPWVFDRCVKDLDVEEPVDLYLHRRLAFWLVIKPIEKLNLTWVTPMQLTLVSIAIGVLAGVVSGMAPEHGMQMCVYGAILIVVHVLLDCADGMLARLRGGGTRLGMLVDGMGDGIVGLAYWAGLSRTIAAELEGVWVWPALVAILLSIGAHTSLYDGIKTKFVAATTPAPLPGVAAPLPSSAQQSDLEKSIEAWIERLYVLYAGYGTTVGKIDRDADMHVKDTARARAALRPAMRSMANIGLGTSLFVMYVSAAVMPVWPTAPLYVGLVLLVGIGNIVMIVALRQWKRGEASLG